MARPGEYPLGLQSYTPDVSGMIGQGFKALELATIAATLPLTTAPDWWFDPIGSYTKYLRTLSEFIKPVEEAPKKTTPYEVAKKLSQGDLLKFSDERSNEFHRVLILSPIAGHGFIADYGPEQSLVEAALQSGACVYAADWSSATYDRRNDSIDGLIEATRIFVKEEICPGEDEKLTLIGLCQGGWQSAVYTALYPQEVEHLVLAGSPIDFKAGNGQIQRLAEIIPMSFYDYLVKLGGQNMSGEFMLMGWKGLHLWDRWIKDPLEVYRNIDDERYMERFRQFRGWYEWTHNIPGVMYKQAVGELFKDNRLIKGEFEVLGRKVDLSRITCPVTLVAGDKDDITLPEQVFNTEFYVGTTDVEKVTVRGGHIGVFIGKEGIEHQWPAIFKRSPFYSQRR